MAFRPLGANGHLIKFNSANSAEFLQMYTDILDNEIKEHNDKPKSKSFAPSSFRCDRYSWFKLRGVQPDAISVPDRTLQFSADIGTACHELIQGRLSEKLGADWINVKDYLDSVPRQFSYDIVQKGFESLIEIKEPYPVRFACDGLLRWKDKLYLLEIKTSEFGSFDSLVEPKPKHIDQIKCYCALLDLSNVLVVYQDRQYGGMKCFELTVSETEKKAVLDKMQYIIQMVDANIAPEGLPVGDEHCSSNMCPYYKKCKEWGR